MKSIEAIATFIDARIRRVTKQGSVKKAATRAVFRYEVDWLKNMDEAAHDPFRRQRLAVPLMLTRTCLCCHAVYCRCEARQHLLHVLDPDHLGSGLGVCSSACS